MVSVSSCSTAGLHRSSSVAQSPCFEAVSETGPNPNGNHVLLVPQELYHLLSWRIDQWSTLSCSEVVLSGPRVVALALAKCRNRGGGGGGGALLHEMSSDS